MDTVRRCSVLGVSISAVDYEVAVDSIMEAVRSRTAFGVSALAVHGVMTGAKDPTHRQRLNSLSMLVPDGQPVRWALKWLHGVDLADRVYGPELMLRICAQAEEQGIPIYLYGSTQETLDALVPGLKRKFPEITFAGASPSQFRRLNAEEKAEVVSRIRTSGAQIVFVGLGCPRQEVWTYEYMEALQMPVIAVGAAFDFHAGTVAQAPSHLQKYGLEWLFRLVKEPKRLWKRYLLLNPEYLARVAVQFIRPSKSSDVPSQREIPLENYG